jgi:hypothetical protein
MVCRELKDSPMSDTPSNPAQDRTYCLNLSLSGESYRLIVDSLGDALSGTHEKDYPVRQITFDCEVKNPWQLGYIHTETRTDPTHGYYTAKPWINLGVSPVMFQQFWEAADAPSGERPDVIIRSEKVSDHFAVTEVRLMTRPTTHLVVVAIDERLRRFEQAARFLAGGLGMMVVIVIALSLILLSR